MRLQIINNSKKILLCITSFLFIGLLPVPLQAQCPDTENALEWGRLAISSFYGNQYLQQDRQQLGVSTNDLSLDEIVPVTDDSVCNQIEAHIMASDQYHETTKNQAKVYFKNEQTGRYFFVSYEDPLRTAGWTTGVYILDENFNKLGGFGV